jgi:TRAP-type C4-dicarboxylate transport system permease large subunit
MTTSLLGIAILLALVFLRVPIAFAMALVGAAGFAAMRGWEATGAMVGTTVFDTGLSYSLSVVPLFILMGNVLAQSGIAHGLFAGADRVFGRMRGGLALATVLSCGGFSAVSGSSLATAATMSKVAMPPMRRFGYDDSLAAGAIAAGGTLALFAFIMGGIYGGFFTPIEAAGMGAIFALLLAFAIRGLSRAGLGDAIRETVRSTGMIFAIVIGAEIFSAFVNFAGLPDALVGMIHDLDVSPWTVILSMVAIYLVMGCVFESLSMILLTVPVFYPIVQQLDFGVGLLADPEMALIWFAVIVVVVTEISLITPPVGMNVFVLRSVIADVPLATIFRGVLPFWLADLVRLALLIGLPSISLALL